MTAGLGGRHVFPSLSLASRVGASETWHKLPRRPGLADILRPVQSTGASDDDPSGIATYSQVGAQFGFVVSLVLLLTYLLMAATPNLHQCALDEACCVPGAH
jgi:hypothetical protein